MMGWNMKLSIFQQGKLSIAVLVHFRIAFRSFWRDFRAIRIFFSLLRFIPCSTFYSTRKLPLNIKFRKMGMKRFKNNIRVECKSFNCDVLHHVQFRVKRRWNSFPFVSIINDSTSSFLWFITLCQFSNIDFRMAWN